MINIINPPIKVKIKSGRRLIRQPILSYPLTIEKEVEIPLAGNEGIALRETSSSIEVQVFTLRALWYLKSEVELL